MKWVLVRCPVCREVLGEVAGAGARLRKVCGRCRPKVTVEYDRASGACTISPVPPGQLTAAGAPAIL